MPRLKRSLKICTICIIYGIYLVMFEKITQNSYVNRNSILLIELMSIGNFKGNFTVINSTVFSCNVEEIAFRTKIMAFVFGNVNNNRFSEIIIIDHDILQ